jgi:uncharacterized membrane protein YqjE
MGESAKAFVRDLDPSGMSDRSMSEVLKDIVGTVQKIVRGEARLAKAEVREEAAKAWKPVRLLLTGAIVGLFAAAYLLLGIVDALTLAIPAWAAAGSVGMAQAIAAAITISRGASRMKQVYPAPERIVDAIKESLE